MDYCKRTWCGDVEVKKVDKQNTSIIICDTVSLTSSTILVGAGSVLDICSSHNYVVYCTDEQKIHVVRLDDLKENYVASIDDLKLVAGSLDFSTNKMTAEDLESATADMKIGQSSKYVSRQDDTVIPSVLLTSTDSSVFMVVNKNGVSSIKRLFTESELCDDRNWRPTVIQCETDILIKQAVSGHAHSVFLTDGGAVYTLGTGSRGELGVGQLTNTSQLLLVEDLDDMGVCVTRIAAGGWHTVASTDSDDVYVWGWNHMGQLGPEKQSSEYAPIPLELDDPIQAIEAFNNWTCVTTNKEVVVYGTDAIGKPSEEVRLNL